MSNKQPHQYQPNAPIQHIFVNNANRTAPPTANYSQDLRFSQHPRVSNVQAQYHGPIVQIPTVVPQAQKPAHPQTNLPLSTPPVYVDPHLANMHPSVSHHHLSQIQMQFPNTTLQRHQVHPVYQQFGPHQHPHNVMQHMAYRAAHDQQYQQPQVYFQQPQNTQINLPRESAAHTVSAESKHIQALPNVPQPTGIGYKEQAYPQQNTIPPQIYQIPQTPEMYQSFSGASNDTSKAKTKKSSHAILIIDPSTNKPVDTDDKSESSINNEKETADKSGVCATFAAQVAAVAAEPSVPKSTNEKDGSQMISSNLVIAGNEVGKVNEEKVQPNSNTNVAADFKAKVFSSLGHNSNSEITFEADLKSIVPSENTQTDSVKNENSPAAFCDADPVVESKTAVVPDPIPKKIIETEIPRDNSSVITGSDREASQSKTELQNNRTEVDFVRAVESKPVLPPVSFMPNFSSDVSKKITQTKEDEKPVKEVEEETVQKHKTDSRRTESLPKSLEYRNSQKRNRSNKNVSKNSDSNKKGSEKEESQSSSNLVQPIVSEKVEAKIDIIPQLDINNEEIIEIKIENIKNENECIKEEKLPETDEEKPTEKPVDSVEDSPISISQEEIEVQEKNKQNIMENLIFAKDGDEITVELKKVEDESSPVAEAGLKVVSSANDSNSNSESTSAKIIPSSLKYTYQDGQWSPMNTEGKKVYGREFLMNLQNDPSSKVKPSNLPDLDVVLNNYVIKETASMDTRMNKDHSFLLPGFVKTFNPKMPTPSKRGGQHSEKQNKSNKTPNVIQFNLRTEVKLRETENAWKPRRVAPASGSEEEKTENLYKKVRSVLNKLTPQKFETLVNQVRDLDIDTEERLQGVIDLVFKKAVDEPNFSVAYALMCKELSTMGVSNAPDGSSNFRKLLINRCQSEFEKNTVDEVSRAEKLKEIQECTDPDKKKELQLNLEEEERIIRVRSVGNIRFIGELFKQGMLTWKIMDQCIRHLLLQIDEENLECLCKLLTTVGKVLEMKKVDLSQYFKKMVNLTTQKGKVSSRIRFMLLDVIDLRNNKWVPRRDDSNPKTMDQIQKEVETEAIIDLNNTMLNTPRKDDRGGGDRRGPGGGNRNNRGGGGSGRQMDEGGWNSIPSKSRQPYTVESAKLKNKPPSMDEMQLGSRQNYQWNQPKQTTPVSVPLINKYSYLENMPEPKEQRPIMNFNTSSRSMESSRTRDYSRTDYNKPSSNFEGRNSRNSNYQSSSRSHSKAREQERPEVQSSMPPPKTTAQAPAPAKIDPEKLQKLVKNYIGEFIQEEGESINQAIENFQSTFPASCHTEIALEILNDLMGQKTSCQQRFSKILSQLLLKKCMSSENFHAALKELIKYSADIKIDVPLFWDYLAIQLAVYASDNTEFLFELKNLLQPPQKDYIVFVAKLLSEINKLVGPKLTTDIWKKSEMKWTDFLDNQVEIEQTLKQNDLNFLL